MSHRHRVQWSLPTSSKCQDPKGKLDFIMHLHYALLCVYLPVCWVPHKVCSGFSVRWYGNKIFGQPINKGWCRIMPWWFEKSYSRCFNNKFIFCRIFAIILLSKRTCLTLLNTLWNWPGRYISFLFYRRKQRIMTTECTNDKMELESTSLGLPQYSSCSFSRRYNI